MKLDNLVALTRGRLLTQSTISSFESVSFEAINVKRGDLFFAFDVSEIDEAIKNGAYIIISDNLSNITDEEVAFIEVHSTLLALRALLRFIIIEKELKCFSCNEIELKLAASVANDDAFLALNSDERAIFKHIYALEKNATVLYSQKLTDPSIFANPKPFAPQETKEILSIEQTLFETSFIYNDTFYERVLLSPFFIPYLQKVLNFFDEKQLSYKIKNFINIGHFEAIFINKNLQIKNFGTSDMVLIFERDSNLFKNQIAFLKEYAPWAKTIFIIPQNMPDRDEFIYTYGQKNEILDLLREQKFHFALIVGCDKNILNEPILPQRQLTFEF